MSDYDRIESAMAYLVDHAADQPDLKEIAAHVHLSPYHFQRMFCRWAGTTPKRFLQVLTLERGKQVDIDYGVHTTPLGRMFVAVTRRGVCRMEFMGFNSLEELLEDLHSAWPLSSIRENTSSTRHVIDAFFASDVAARHGPLSLHVAGTNFQIAVWRALLKIPPGAVASYGQVAKSLGTPRSARAVANGIGANPVALLIPCRWVIQQNGALGGYRWGPAKKLMVQTWERMRDESVAL
ncbi:MAG: bifunctional helix-turn-helix domain-containing protein/methylated-DNA--[protein]-cysteine S-methyltransferase [Moraxellaceae bacterium]|nr:bifunctional helix-turn-helix domain-containing protein/methylated-DNA--[protein]-cysteine S-methyltransferase [Moraxellaceae bacterium]MDZ4386324.1 bifunctional helix-turn-helix domain-containing protein/methylated-DNA--[protein]-cysteine S-methyltransferase [Moraxellaceae bacterium]